MCHQESTHSLTRSIKQCLDIEILGFIVSCNLTFIPLSDCLYIAVVFKPIVNT